jgi:hypothetical protein
MNLQYYVLGKENNPMLIDYMGRYYLLLQDFVKTFENEAIKEKVLSLF